MFNNEIWLERRMFQNAARPSGGRVPVPCCGPRSTFAPEVAHQWGNFQTLCWNHRCQRSRPSWSNRGLRTLALIWSSIGMRPWAIKFISFLVPPGRSPDGLTLPQSYLRKVQWFKTQKKTPILSKELTYPPNKAYLKMIFLFPRWDMLVSWRVISQTWYPTPTQTSPTNMGRHPGWFFIPLLLDGCALGWRESYPSIKSEGVPLPGINGGEITPYK